VRARPDRHEAYDASLDRQGTSRGISGTAKVGGEVTERRAHRPRTRIVLVPGWQRDAVVIRRAGGCGVTSARQHARGIHPLRRCITRGLSPSGAKFTQKVPQIRPKKSGQKLLRFRSAKCLILRDTPQQATFRDVASASNMHRACVYVAPREEPPDRTGLMHRDGL
jgi:hypothetical protein